MRAIRAWLLVFVVGLVLSGATAFPLVAEVRLLSEVLHVAPAPDGLVTWIDRIRDGLVVTGANYPFIAYGTDWLAFAHLAIAIAFWGPWRDPVRNIWVIEWGMICCVAMASTASRRHRPRRPADRQGAPPPAYVHGVRPAARPRRRRTVRP